MLTSCGRRRRRRPRWRRRLRRRRLRSLARLASWRLPGADKRRERERARRQRRRRRLVTFRCGCLRLWCFHNELIVGSARRGSRVGCRGAGASPSPFPLSLFTDSGSPPAARSPRTERRRPWAPARGRLPTGAGSLRPPRRHVRR